MNNQRTPGATGAELADFLLRPRSVALIGVSDDPHKAAARPLTFLRHGGFAGSVYPVNAKRTVVQNEKSWPSVAALPEVPEHAFVLAPTAAVTGIVQDCANAGVPLVTILASGFSEAGIEGAARERRLLEIAGDTGIRIVGPSSLGVVNLHNRLTLTANAAFQEVGLPAGGIFGLSHSGSMIGALVSRGKARGIGFAGLVSVGNEVDLSIGEIAGATVDDEDIDSYILFLEAITHADHLREFAKAAAERHKPILAYVLGRSDAGAELALSHTGALTSEADVTAAFLDDCGIARVECLDSLFEGVELARRLELSHKMLNVGLVTTTGGGAAMIVDQLGLRGVNVTGPTSKTLDALAEAATDVAPARIVDLTLAGTTYSVMKAALGVMVSAPEFDLVIVVVGSSARFNPEIAVQPIVEIAETGARVAVFIVPEASEALCILTSKGVPCFRTPEACADSVSAAIRRRSPKDRASIAIGGEAGTPAGSNVLDELATYSLLDDLGIARAETYEFLPGPVGVDAMPFTYPVVAKVVSADIPHKSNVGGVVVGIESGPELVTAIELIRQQVARHVPGARASRIAVQPMYDGVGEVLVGYRRDPKVGPVVLLAAGGELAEIYQDRSIRMAPVDRTAAQEMVKEVRALSVLEGFRSRPPGDVDALLEVIVAFSQLADHPDVLEAEINPLLVRREKEGVMAVDALAILR